MNDAVCSTDTGWYEIVEGVRYDKINRVLS